MSGELSLPLSTLEEENDIGEQVAERKVEKTWPPCGVCNDGTASTSWCRQCPYYLCARCSSYHGRLRPTRNHSLLHLTAGLDSLPHETQGAESSHPGGESFHDSGVSTETSEVNENNSNVLSVLKQKNKRENAMVLLADVLSENRQLLLTKAGLVRARQVDIERAVSRLHAHESECQSHRCSLQTQISDSRRAVESMIARATQSLMKELDHLYRSETRLIDKQVQKLKRLKQSVESCCEYAHKLAQKSCDAELVSMVTSAYSELAALEGVVIPGPVPRYLQNWTFQPGTASCSVSEIRSLIGQLSHSLSVFGRSDEYRLIDMETVHSDDFEEVNKSSDSKQSSLVDSSENENELEDTSGSNVSERDEGVKFTLPNEPDENIFDEVHLLERPFRPKPPKPSPSKSSSPRTPTPSPHLKLSHARRRFASNPKWYRQNAAKVNPAISEEGATYSEKFDSVSTTDQSISEVELVSERSNQCTQSAPCQHVVRLAYVDCGVNTTVPFENEGEVGATAVGSDVVKRLTTLEEENKELKHAIADLRAMAKKVEKLESRLSALEGGATKEAKPANKESAEEEEDDDDDIDLFGSDEEEDEEAERLKQERVKMYQEKKSKKPTVIAKSNVILDIKPWDDETDMAEMERLVRTIEMDGLLWGASKLVPLAYGIKKLQIAMVIEDDKVSVDIMEEKITEYEDYVQSVDVAAFNKI